ncbi:MAG: fibrobacter succinogenes major paralogous domain-containing protein [bacterium]
MRPFISSVISLSMALMLIIGCSKSSSDDPANIPVIPVLKTASVNQITQTTANSGGVITSDGGAQVTSRGVCWSTGIAPTIIDMHTSDGSGTGSYASQISGLSPNTLYYIRAYATNSAGTAYGDTLSFTTMKFPGDTVVDYDGNIYHKVTIGTQVWLTGNLKTTHYRNGDSIPLVTSDAQWKVLTTGAWCIYDNLPSNAKTYGRLYNWHAVNDSRGLCPEGWHVPSVNDWNSLALFLGGENVAGGKMKTTGTIEQGNGFWYEPNTGATNSSGFNGLPGGYRINYGNYYSIGNVAYFWSSSDTTLVNSWNFVLDANNENLIRHYNFQTNGFSVRCIRD